MRFTYQYIEISNHFWESYFIRSTQIRTGSSTTIDLLKWKISDKVSKTNTWRGWDYNCSRTLYCTVDSFLQTAESLNPNFFIDPPFLLLNRNWWFIFEQVICCKNCWYSSSKHLSATLNCENENIQPLNYSSEKTKFVYTKLCSDRWSKKCRLDSMKYSYASKQVVFFISYDRYGSPYRNIASFKFHEIDRFFEKIRH